MNTEIYDIKVLKADKNVLKTILSRLDFVLSQCNLSRLEDFIETLRDDLVVGVETMYVDAMYRDEYYRFYATKLHTYDRFCVKMTFFRPGHLVPGHPVDYRYAKQIKEDFWGFLVIRPLQACIGRNVIAPEAKKDGLNNIEICRSYVKTTALGLKVQVNGFPHASQDGEMMSCAETTLWSIAEYYGHKYPNHKPICPSEILKAMRPTAQQRQLPSGGLSFEQISVGLCDFGFSTQIYDLYQYDKGEKKYVLLPGMKEILACYIESGFPLALCLTGKEVGHAVVCVGRTKKSHSDYVETESLFDHTFHVWNKSIDTIVMNDDNAAPYQISKIENPIEHYDGKEWQDVLLMQFMVPLPSKVYMDANIAVSLSKLIAVTMPDTDNCYIRTFLASSRSFREHIATSKYMENNDKSELLNMNLPRFVWVTELAQKQTFQQNMVEGLIILDATEPTFDNEIPLLLRLYCDTGIIYDDKRFRHITLTRSLCLESYDKNIN